MVYLIKNSFQNGFSNVKCQGSTKLNGTYSLNTYIIFK